MKLPMRTEAGSIFIKVLPEYEYDTRISEIGQPDDHPEGLSAWAWVNHLREKNWWSKENEEEFLSLAKILCQGRE